MFRYDYWPMKTIALELVPPATNKPGFSVKEEACRIAALLETTGLRGMINTILVPQLVPEDEGRPVALESRMDPLDVRQAFAPHLAASYILTQVTVHTEEQDLRQRVADLCDAGVRRLVFVGAPRNNNRELPGPQPETALTMFQDVVPSKGVILIPTRVGEAERFVRKLDAGADFAVTQLLFSDHVIHFLRGLQAQPKKPEILLSFGYVPRAEVDRGLLQWLIRDEKSPFVGDEVKQILQLAAMPLEQRKAAQVAHYRKVVQEASLLGFPIGIHFECPYGVTAQALDTFRAMLDVWCPE